MLLSLTGREEYDHPSDSKNIPFLFYTKSQPEDVFQSFTLYHSARPPKSCLHPTKAADLNVLTAEALPVRTLYGIYLIGAAPSVPPSALNYPKRLFGPKEMPLSLEGLLKRE